MANLLTMLPILSIACVALLALYVARLRYKLRQAESRMDSSVSELSHELQGLSNAAIGVGRHTTELEKEIEVLKTGVEEIRSNDPAVVSYTEASKLVELGADVSDLMSSCGISRPEAELVFALTHSKVQGGKGRYRAANQADANDADVNDADVNDNVPLLTVTA